MSARPAEISTSGPLSAEDHQALAVANQRLKKVRRAGFVAAFNAWTTGFFALCSLLFTIRFFGVVSVLITIGLMIVTVNELFGRKLIRRLQPHGFTLLGRNQLFFMTMICAYCAWRIYVAFTGPNEFEDPQVRSLLVQLYDLKEEDIKLLGEMYFVVMCLMYGLIILLTIMFQGGNAIYYYMRGRMLRQYLSETSEWIVRVQQATG